jgi:hypothetical protein
MLEIDVYALIAVLGGQPVLSPFIFPSPIE